MSTRFGVTCVMYVSVLVVGCGGGLSEKERIEKMTGVPMKTVVPVEGTVLVDGQPQENVLVTLYKSDGKKPLPPNVLIEANEDGKFSLGTYKQGDGVLAGDYKLTFEWHKIKKRGLNPTFEGPDKLKGRYSDPLKSEFTLKAVEGEPQKDLIFELKSK